MRKFITFEKGIEVAREMVSDCHSIADYINRKFGSAFNPDTHSIEMEGQDDETAEGQTASSDAEEKPSETTGSAESVPTTLGPAVVAQVDGAAAPSGSSPVVESSKTSVPNNDVTTPAEPRNIVMPAETGVIGATGSSI